MQGQLRENSAKIDLQILGEPFGWVSESALKRLWGMLFVYGRRSSM